MLGQLDLDDIGAPIGQLANGRGTRADTREVKDSEARQRAGSIRNGHVLTSREEHMLRQRRADCKGSSPTLSARRRQSISAM